MSFDKALLPDPVSYYENQGLTIKGRGNNWRAANCLFHGGSDSFQINATSGAFNCFSCQVKGGDVLSFHMQLHGTEFVSAAKELGAWVDDGREPVHHKPSPLSPRQALSVLAFEATLVAVAAGNVANGVTLSDTDRSRLMAAANRVNTLREAFT
jgi:hypothetical protein